MGYTVWNLTQGGASGWCGDYATKEGAIAAVTRWRKAWPRCRYSVRPSAKSKGRVYG
jgi:hypothetical protein